MANPQAAYTYQPYDPTGRTGTGARRSTKPLRPVYTVSPGVVGDEQQAPDPQPTPQPAQPAAPQTSLYSVGKPQPLYTFDNPAAGAATGGTQSARPVYKPSGYAEASRRYQYLLTSPVEDENGRFKSGINVGAYAASETARQTQSLGQTVGAGIGGLVAGLLRPQTDEALRRPYEIQRAGAAMQTAAATDRAEREAQTADAENDLRRAQATYYSWRPENEKAKADAQALTRQQTALRTELRQRASDPRPFDENDPYDADLMSRAQGAGVHFDARGFGDNKNPFSIEVIDPRDPSGTTKTREVYNRQTRQFEPLTNAGQPVSTGYAQPVIGSGPNAGMTPAQARGATDRETGQVETRRHNTVTEGQGGDRSASRVRRGSGLCRSSCERCARDGRMRAGAAFSSRCPPVSAWASRPTHRASGTPEGGSTCQKRGDSISAIGSISASLGDPAPMGWPFR